MDNLSDNSTVVMLALDLANRGLKVFPLQPGSKEPKPGQRWSEIATSDPETVRGWAKHQPGINFGICPGERHVVVDLDRKLGKDGIEAFGLLELEHGAVDTFTVATPSGGFHKYFAVPEAADNAHSFPEGIDVRGAGGYVVGPGCVLVEGQCKQSDTPGCYAVAQDVPIAAAPEWIVDRLHSRGAEGGTEQVGELDTPGSIERAREFIRQRPPAIEGLGGDHHTLVTAMRVMDFGISEEMTLELLTAPHTREGEIGDGESWNERCVPPWDVYGRKGTLEEKVRNATRYREKAVGAKTGDDFEVSNVVDIADMDSTAAVAHADGGADKDNPASPFGRWSKLVHRGASILTAIKPPETVIAEWLPAHGLTALLAKRGTGKTLVLIDQALSIATDRRWCGQPTRQGFCVVYLCGEDQPNTAGHIDLWCRSNGLSAPPDRFLFVEDTPNLMDGDDVRELVAQLKVTLPRGARVVLFVDTWQRASAASKGQNDEKDMQAAIRHIEAMGKALNGPVVAAFHPPKGNEFTISGTQVIENVTVAIWRLEEHAAGRKLSVIRIKGKGTGNYRLFEIKEVPLGRREVHGGEVTAAMVLSVGGLEAARADEDYRRRLATAVDHVLFLELSKDDGNVPMSRRAMAQALIEAGFAFPNGAKSLRAAQEALSLALSAPVELPTGNVVRMDRVPGGNWTVNSDLPKPPPAALDVHGYYRRKDLYEDDDRGGNS